MRGLRTTLRWKGGSTAIVQALKLEFLEGPEAGRTTWADREELSVGTADNNDVVVVDPTVSRYHVELLRVDEGVRVHDQGSTNGTFVGAARLGDAVVPPGTTLRLGRTQMRVADGTELDVELSPSTELGPLRGCSPAMRRVMSWIERAARSSASVLFVGESGTGKEVAARALHAASERSAEAFVTVDCGALTPSLISSELFGHEKGAFTGADRRHIGAFERADGGSLFLDEIGELPRELQPMLLGALERKTIRRVGGKVETPVDVRVIAATNRDLRAEVNEGSFRLDLYYRLAVLRQKLPPLRERPEDLPILIDAFLHAAGYEGKREALFPGPTMKALEAHRFMGNVRELRNLVEAAVALEEAPEIEERELRGEEEEGGCRSRRFMNMPYKAARNEVLASFEEEYMRSLLERTEGNVSEAARQAEMDRSYLFSLLKRHGLR